jgi:uncharacterized protein (DUF169 family)
MKLYNEASAILKSILNLDREPVGVKFLKTKTGHEELLNNYDDSTKMHYCQALMEASHGRKIALNAGNLNCAASSAAMGFIPLHPKLASGMAHFNAGTLGTPEAAKKILTEMPRLEENFYQYVILSPLSAIECEPDVVALETYPEAIMWLSLASIYTTGERISFNTAVVQATCVDSTIVPLKTNKINASLGCVGCRASSDLQNHELIIGIPFSQFEGIIANLQQLNEKIIPQNRTKTGLARFQNK